MDLHTLSDTVADVVRAAWALRWWGVTIGAFVGMVAFARAAGIGTNTAQIGGTR